MKAAIAGKPVVVLAINSDKSPTVPPSRQARHHVVPGIDADQRPKGVEQYLTDAISSPQTSSTVTIPASANARDCGLGADLWIDPSGKKATTRGYDASNFRDVASGQEFTLPANIAKESNLGKFKVMSADFPDQLQVVLWPFEMGLGSEAALKKVRGTLRGDQKDKLAEALDEFLTGQSRKSAASTKARWRSDSRPTIRQSPWPDRSRGVTKVRKPGKWSFSWKKTSNSRGK